MKKQYTVPYTSDVVMRCEHKILAGSIITETTHPDVGDGTDYTRRQNDWQVEWDME